MSFKWSIGVALICLMIAILVQVNEPHLSGSANAQSVTPTPTSLPPVIQPDDVTTYSQAPGGNALALIPGLVAAPSVPPSCSVLATRQGSITTANPVETGRLTRNGVSTSCAAVKSFPGFNDSTPHHYWEDWFTNATSSAQCFAVDVTQSCTTTNSVFFATYLNSFNPSDPSANYLADIGTSPLPTGTYSFKVPAGAAFGIVANEVTPNVGCANFAFTLKACTCWDTSVTDFITTTNSLTQTGRLFRDGNAATCLPPKVFPGTTTTDTLHYKEYQFTNTTSTTACYKVDVNAPLCRNSNFIFVSAYLGAYDPAHLSTHYLADIGTSPNPDGSFSFQVPAGQDYTLVVNEITAGAGCPGYTLNLSNCAYQVCLPAVQR